MRVHSSTFISNTAPRSHFSSNVVQAVKNVNRIYNDESEKYFLYKDYKSLIELIIEK